MKIVKFVLFIASMLFIVFIANYLQFNRQKTDKKHGSDFDFNTSNIVLYEYGDIKSICTIYFNTKQDVVAKLFNTNIQDIQNTLLSKDIKIDTIDAKLILFAGEHRIEQITVLVEAQLNDSINKIIEDIKQKVSLNVPAEIEEIENANGELTAIITKYNASKYDFIITQYFDNTGTGFTIDLQNDIYSYQ